MFLRPAMTGEQCPSFRRHVLLYAYVSPQLSQSLDKKATETGSKEQDTGRESRAEARKIKPCGLFHCHRLLHEDAAKERRRKKSLLLLCEFIALLGTQLTALAFRPIQGAFTSIF